MSAPETAAAPAHPGADFDVTGERPPIEKAPTVDDLALVMAGLFVVRDGNVVEADTIDVPIVGEVDADGVVRWAGGER